MYYDRLGKEIDLMTWAMKLEDAKEKRVALTRLWWGGRVSTVWLGLDHHFGPTGPPLIFETMVFLPSWGKVWGHDIDMERYSFLEHAETGHAMYVRKWSNPIEILKTWIWRK